jgi:fructokinase
MKYRVIGIGELLWDLLPAGRQMGGAPANFAYHARALCADGRVISRVGNDPLGAELIQLLKELQVPTTGISLDPIHPTGTVTIQLAPDGQPTYTIHENVAWDNLGTTPELVDVISTADAVCFGTLGQRSQCSRQAIRELIAATRESAIRVFDVNLRQNFYSLAIIEESLRLANVLKLNDSELPVLTELLCINGGVEELLERYNLRFVACTRGSEGSLLYDGKQVVEQPGLKVSVRDTIGAGDSFTAAVTLGLLAGWDTKRIGDVANRVAAFVCSCAGATPPLPDGLRSYF